jgi:heme o synthase
MADPLSEVTPAAVPWTGAGARQRVADYLALAKPRVVMMVLVTTLVGYYLGSDGTPSTLLRLLHTLLGTALAAGGTLALNQYMERDLDRRMERTRRRPLPDGRLLPIEALVFGVGLLLSGLAYLRIAVNAPAALVTTAIAATYLLLYTPLKPVTSL